MRDGAVLLSRAAGANGWLCSASGESRALAAACGAGRASGAATASRCQPTGGPTSVWLRRHATTIIRVAGRDVTREQLASVVDDDVQLEAVEPAQRGCATLR